MKIHIHMKNLPNSYFYYSYFTPNFLNRYFSELLFPAAVRKINKIYPQKLKPGDREWVFNGENYVFTSSYFAFYRIYNSRFHGVSLAALCALLINTLVKVHLINSEANLRPLKHLKWSSL